MAKLTLIENGETRRFKLSSGKLTFGSGDAATLKLASDDVAALHGQIEMGAEGALLSVAKGVMPPRVKGSPIKSPYTLRDGQPVHIGSATITVEYDEGEGPVETKAAPHIKRTEVAGRRAAGASAVRSRSYAQGDDGEVSRRRHSIERKSNPAGMIIGALVALGLVVLAYFFITQTSKGLSGESFDYDVRARRIEREMGPGGSTGRARKDIEFLLDQEITVAQRKDLEEKLAQLDEVKAQAIETARNTKANDWFQERLKVFYDKFDAGTSRPHARLFLKRAEWFLDNYPTHPEREWIERMIENTVRDAAELDSPQTFDDLEVEVWGHAAKLPKDYVLALEAIDDFEAKNGPSVATQALRAEVEAGEKEFYDTALHNAAISYDKTRFEEQYAPSKAIHDMISVLATCANPVYRAEAAARLLKITELTPEHVRKYYKREQPADWARMIEQPLFRDWAEENDLL